MADKGKQEELLQGSVAFIGLFVILPLAYYDKIDFLWTGIILWLVLSLIMSGILTHFQPQIEQKRKENEAKK